MQQKKNSDFHWPASKVLASSIHDKKRRQAPPTSQRHDSTLHPQWQNQSEVRPRKTHRRKWPLDAWRDSDWRRPKIFSPRLVQQHKNSPEPWGNRESPSQKHPLKKGLLEFLKRDWIDAWKITNSRLEANWKTEPSSRGFKPVRTGHGECGLWLAQTVRLATVHADQTREHGPISNGATQPIPIAPTTPVIN